MKLIINADDFGLSKSITDGIVYGMKKGFITSTTIMANMPYAKYAIESAKENNITAIGLHINLTVGKPLTNCPNLTDENGIFLYNEKQINNKYTDYESVYNEIMAQIEFVESQGIMLDHMDTHHHLVDNAIIQKVILDISKQKNLPLRKDNYRTTTKTTDELYKKFTISGLEFSLIRNLVDTFISTDKTIEMMTHPGYVDNETRKITSYLERDKELQLLEEAYNKGLFEDLELISFSDL